MVHAMKNITICSSASFYQQAFLIEDQLKALGFQVTLPDTAHKMKQADNFDVDHYKTWFRKAEDYVRKSELIRGHFDKIAQSDVILVLNFRKNNVDNYIGGNVLIEMGVAFHLKKPIFILNDSPKNSPFEEEILGMQPIFLQGDVLRLATEYDKFTNS